MRQVGIYAIVHVESGRVYIGSSVNISARLSHHRGELNRGIHCNVRLQRAWLKYGPTAFMCEVREVVDDPAMLVEREQAHLDAAQPNVYNTGPIAKAPWLGVKRGPMPAEWRAKISASNIGKPKPPFTAEHRARMSAARRGKPNLMTPEHRAKLEAARQARRGIKMSEEARRRMCEAKRGRTHTMSPDAREKMRLIALARKPPSAETRAKMSESAKRRGCCASFETLSRAQKGRKHSPEHREKIRLALVGKRHSDEVRALLSQRAREVWARRKAQVA